MPRYKLTIAYDGTDFCGWQKQEPPAPSDQQPRAQQAPDRLVRPDLDTSKPGRIALRSVQAIVEHAVRQVVREPVNLTGASRTDAGVHAAGQCAAFTTSQAATEGRGWPAERGVEPLVRAVNSRLPDDVLILEASIVNDEFDPIADCVSKQYTYTIHNSIYRPLFSRACAFHDPRQLDPARMAAAAKHLVGTHDFTSLAALHHGRQTAVRTIHTCDVSTAPLDLPSRPDQQMKQPPAEQRTSESTIRITVSGDGFLYNMVRILAGTLTEVGRGKFEPDDIPKILEAKDRRASGPTLPPEGLRLDWIRYPSA